MDKKLKLLIILFFASINSMFADRAFPPPLEPITKNDTVYRASYIGSEKYFFGLIRIESQKIPKYYYSVPVYTIKLDPFLEGDVQWRIITSMEFKNDEIITVENENDEVFEFNINTHESVCVKGKSDTKLNRFYEDTNKGWIEQNKKYKYNGIQPAKKKLAGFEDAIAVAESVLFPIYGEEKIRSEMPYRIIKYKDKWFVRGSFRDGRKGGVFEIVIDSKTSKIESVIHGK